ncbi:MAG: hypothetical protein VX447_07495 [Pseudomonadota bacterium]|uniref:hypothetical protein n=1 Tax=Gallaecimonas pentaromativorans TaxID=584787 RepID=UPI00067F32A8|nr:hypothetical protein [Gallaecimonas pentaromativorans]MED5524577.1 hypothetical protein [Pseudomonadota bacterium]
MNYCVIYSKSSKNSLDELIEKIKLANGNACLVEATEETVKKASVGDTLGLSKEIVDCINGADECFFFIADDNDENELINLIAEYVGGEGKNFSGVFNAQDEPAEVFNNLAKSFFSVNSLNYDEVLLGNPVWERNGRKNEVQKIVRVRCQ